MSERFWVEYSHTEIINIDSVCQMMKETISEL